MKLKALSVLAGFGGSLIVSGPAPGAFQGFLVVSKWHDGGLRAANVYAQFNNPDDRLLAVAGTAGAPMIVEILGGALFQHKLGGDTAPQEDLVQLFPSLAYDTFVTIGVKVNAGDDWTTLTPHWPGYGPSSLSGDDLAWFVPPDSEQAAPDASLRVLIGQFSGAEWAGVSGRFLVLAISDGEPAVFHTGYCVFPLGGAPCTEGDVNFDNVANVKDFLRMLGAWGPCQPDDDYCWEDLNRDGVVNLQDFFMLLANWTPAPLPLPWVDADLDGDGVVGVLDLLTFWSCWGPVVEGCEPPDLDGDGMVGTRDLLVMLVDWD
ncbi:MAG: hypothetical protein ACYTA3_04815 [Planctomycetota bacterium]